MSLPQGWVELKDASSGRTYYSNKAKKLTSWTKPEPEEEPLPPGWKEYTQAGTGKTYFVNKATGTTSWERPKARLSIASSSAFSTPQQQLHQRTSTRQSAIADSDNGLPPGWVERDDPSSGRKYYVNKTDNSRSWDKPGEEKKTNYKTRSLFVSAADEAEADEEDKSLPPGWFKFEDSTGKPYYFNQELNETRWEKPLDAASMAQKSREIAAELPDRYASPVHDDNEEELAEGWVEFEDPSTGNKYYFNQDENETRWDKPLSAAAMAKKSAAMAARASTSQASAPTSTSRSVPDKPKPKKKDPLEDLTGPGPTGVYLVYSPDSGGRLLLQYSKGYVPANPVGLFTPSQPIKHYKFTTNGGQQELIQGIAGGDSNKRKYYNGWCQFLKLAKQMDGLVIKFPLAKQGVEVDVYAYTREDLSSHFVDLDAGFTSMAPYDAVAVMPRNMEFLRGVKKALPGLFLEKGNVAGATTLL